MNYREMAKLHAATESDFIHAVGVLREAVQFALNDDHSTIHEVTRRILQDGIDRVNRIGGDK